MLLVELAIIIGSPHGDDCIWMVLSWNDGRLSWGLAVGLRRLRLSCSLVLAGSAAALIVLLVLAAVASPRRATVRIRLCCLVSWIRVHLLIHWLLRRVLMVNSDLVLKLGCGPALVDGLARLG